MKKIYALILSVAIVSLSTATSWAAEAQATEAKVLKITGSATVQLPGQSAAVALVEGMSLPAGSTITTGAGSEVQVQPFAGGLSSVGQNSTVALRGPEEPFPPVLSARQVPRSLHSAAL